MADGYYVYGSAGTTAKMGILLKGQSGYDGSKKE
jgi:hypothetical protein